MNILDYLQSNFLNLEALLEQTGIGIERLRDVQEKHCMPACSYRLNNISICKSPIKTIETTTEAEYYARGYTSWLNSVCSHGDAKLAFEEFESRYMKQTKLLLQNELQNYAAPWLDTPNEHLQTEWNHFLAGTYGVCTRNGLPEQIVTKELSAARISEIISAKELDQCAKAELQTVVDLMDSTCSEFAPHELVGSSRQRLIDDVRQRFQLDAPTQTYWAMTQNC